MDAAKRKATVEQMSALLRARTWSNHVTLYSADRHGLGQAMAGRALGDARRLLDYLEQDPSTSWPSSSGPRANDACADRRRGVCVSSARSSSCVARGARWSSPSGGQLQLRAVPRAARRRGDEHRPRAQHHRRRPGPRCAPSSASTGRSGAVRALLQAARRVATSGVSFQNQQPVAGEVLASGPQHRPYGRSRHDDGHHRRHLDRRHRRLPAGQRPRPRHHRARP